MVPIIIPILFVGTSLVYGIGGSLLMRHFHRYHRDEWVSLGQPIGPWWAPAGLRGELLMGISSRSVRNGFLVFWYWIFFTPDWLKTPEAAHLKRLLMVERVCIAVGWLLLIAIFLS